MASGVKWCWLIQVLDFRHRGVSGGHLGSSQEKSKSTHDKSCSTHGWGVDPRYHFKKGKLQFLNQPISSMRIFWNWEFPETKWRVDAWHLKNWDKDMFCQVGMARLAEFFLRITNCLAIFWKTLQFHGKNHQQKLRFSTKKHLKNRTVKVFAATSLVCPNFRSQNLVKTHPGTQTRPGPMQCEPSIGWWCSWHHVWDTWPSWESELEPPMESLQDFVGCLEFESEKRKRSDPKSSEELPKQKVAT